MVTEKVEGKDNAPLYLNLSGKAGCGKSAVMKCVSRYIKRKAKPYFIKIGAPTGTAAFIVNRKTLNSLFRLSINSKKEELQELSGKSFRDL